MAWDINVDMQQRRIAIVGELTIFSVLDIRTRLLEVFASLDEVDIDLGEVTEVDTAGLQLMLLAKRKDGKAARFLNHSDEILRLINLANIGHILGDPLLIKAR